MAGFVAIAIHHAAPEHADEFIEFMHRVIEATEGAPEVPAADPQRAHRL